MKLVWHNYRYYPYERELARRESASLLSGARLNETFDGFEAVGTVDHNAVKRLTYFSGLVNGQSFTRTVQDRLETHARNGKNRQATRYSVHGLHEYKGKFNPQVAKSLLNIFGTQPGDNVLDPFCGSGTTLVECAHMGIRGFGTDLNPLAIYIANAKLLALTTPAAQLRSALNKIADVLLSSQSRTVCIADSGRSRYLEDWFDLPVLQSLETVRTNIEAEASSLAPVFLVTASNLIRGYSHQDPHDLRIRRRKSPLPSTPFVDAFLFSAKQALACIEGAQYVLDGETPFGQAILCDAMALESQRMPGSFDAAVTSPPYATALPYIDTLRLSLVWLELVDANHIHELEATLIGSREIRGTARRKAIEDQESNSARLPARVAEFCALLKQAIGPADGFRRKAVPSLLYRYFVAMRNSFAAVRQTMKPGAPFGLIVGHNHTVLGGVRYDINTPSHLASLAEDTGWAVEEVLELQAYQRYGYNMNNGVSAESLIVLRA